MSDLDNIIGSDRLQMGKIRGYFQIRFLYIWARLVKVYWNNLILINPIFVRFGGIVFHSGLKFDIHERYLYMYKVKIYFFCSSDPGRGIEILIRQETAICDVTGWRPSFSTSLHEEST